MKWRSLLFLFTCFLMQKEIFGQDTGLSIDVTKKKEKFEFTCKNGKWNPQKNDKTENLFELVYKDEDSNEYTCEDKGGSKSISITIRFRTCETCIELDSLSLTSIIVGNLLTTFLIGYAVYSIVSQPKGKNFSGNKASDKVNLIPNGERDTYQPLTAGQSAEYSRLGPRKN